MRHFQILPSFQTVSTSKMNQIWDLGTVTVLCQDLIYFEQVTVPSGTVLSGPWDVRFLPVTQVTLLRDMGLHPAIVWPAGNSPPPSRASKMPRPSLGWTGALKHKRAWLSQQLLKKGLQWPVNKHIISKSFKICHMLP